MRIGRIETNIRSPGVGIFPQDLLPSLAAVAGAIDATFPIGSEGVAEDGGEGNVRVRRMHDQRADLTRLFPDVLPGFAGVSGLVDTVAGGDVAADVRLARADVN